MYLGSVPARPSDWVRCLELGRDGGCAHTGSSSGVCSNTDDVRGMHIRAQERVRKKTEIPVGHAGMNGLILQTREQLVRSENRNERAELFRGGDMVGWHGSE